MAARRPLHAGAAAPAGLGRVLGAIRGVDHQPAVVVGRSVAPPDRAAFAQGTFGRIDRLACGFLGHLVTCAQGHADLAARRHQLCHPEGFVIRAELRIGRSPEATLDDEIPAVRGVEQLR